MKRKVKKERDRETVCRIAERWPFWPSDAAVSRILDKVGAKFVPTDLDREQFRRDLHGFRVAHLGFAANTKSRQHVRKTVADKVARHTDALFKILVRPPDRMFDLYLWPLPLISRDQLLSGLQQLHIAAKQFEPPTPSNATTSWVINQLMPVYERHIKREKGRSRQADEATGPCVNFLRAVAKEIGVHVSGHTVDAVIKKNRRTSSMGKNLTHF